MISERKTEKTTTLNDSMVSDEVPQAVLYNPLTG